MLVEPKDTELTAVKTPTSPMSFSLFSPVLLMYRYFQFLQLILCTGLYCVPPFLISGLGLWLGILAFTHTSQLPGCIAVLVRALLAQALLHYVNTAEPSSIAWVLFLSLPPFVFFGVNVCLNFCLPGLFCAIHHAIRHHIAPSSRRHQGPIGCQRI